MGERVARDMVAVRIGPDIRMAAVATPAYFAVRGKPKVPQDLSNHTCINMRFATLGNVYAWEFEKGSRELNVRVDGQLTVNDIAVIRQAALNGLGIAFIPEDRVQADVDAGSWMRVLADWTPPFPGYYLYYPSRRQHHLPSPCSSMLFDIAKANVRLRANPDISAPGYSAASIPRSLRAALSCPPRVDRKRLKH